MMERALSSVRERLDLRLKENRGVGGGGGGLGSKEGLRQRNRE